MLGLLPAPALLCVLGGCHSCTSSASEEALLRQQAAPTQASTEASGRAPPPHFALVELFTSEGCSSCPAADANLALLADEAARSQQRVFTLELHVDYWNSQGWTDPFSDHEYSVRQANYAAHFPGVGRYTPQLVINGSEQVAGSQLADARAAIARALAKPARADVSVSMERAGQHVLVRYGVVDSATTELNLLVADDSDESRVTAGENAQRTLLHRHVVRSFRKVRLKDGGSGTWATTWPGRSDAKALYAVAYVSDPSSLEVLGAADCTLPPEK